MTALRRVADEQRRPVRQVMTAAIESYVRREAGVQGPRRGLADFAVLSRLDEVLPGQLPDRPAVCTVTVAELMATASRDARDCLGWHWAKIRRMQEQYEVIGFDSVAARSYGLLAATGATVPGYGMLVASVAEAHGLALYTTEPDDYADVASVVTVVPVRCVGRTTDGL